MAAHSKRRLMTHLRIFVSCLLVLLAAGAMVPSGFASAVKGQRVLVSSSNGWESSVLTAPCVIFNGSAFMMYYFGEGPAQIDSIGVATSPDGVTWTRYTQNPVLLVGSTGSWDSGSVNYLWVIFEGGQYKMWYSGQLFQSYGKKILGWAIGYATSPDGFHWTKYSGNPIFTPGASGSFDEKWVLRPIVIGGSSSYTMYYLGINSKDLWTTGIATSSDGIHWTRTGSISLPRGSSGWDADFGWRGGVSSVISVAGHYLMTYDGHATANGPYQIGFATSTDGVNWTPYPQNPVITYGSGDWDAGGVNTPTTVIVGNQYYVYYHAYNSLDYQSIGLAKIPMSQIPIP